MSVYIYCQTCILLQNSLSVPRCKESNCKIHVFQFYFFPTSSLNATFFSKLWHLTLLRSTFFLSWGTERTSRSVCQEWRLEFPFTDTAVTICINVLNGNHNLGWFVLNRVGNVQGFNPHTAQERNRGVVGQTVTFTAHSNLLSCVVHTMWTADKTNSQLPGNMTSLN